MEGSPDVLFFAVSFSDRGNILSKSDKDVLETKLVIDWSSSDIENFSPFQQLQTSPHYIPPRETDNKNSTLNWKHSITYRCYRIRNTFFEKHSETSPHYIHPREIDNKNSTFNSKHSITYRCYRIRNTFFEKRKPFTFPAFANLVSLHSSKRNRQQKLHIKLETFNYVQMLSHPKHLLRKGKNLIKSRFPFSFFNKRENIFECPPEQWEGKKLRDNPEFISNANG
ncbi:hypothetical protein CDAR_217791 [Caerostris darwini]|uniref:Ycf1 n=1 Tax=Caerostris darwini TaxID=1538125 RepID=A0AAV4MWM2_9ARAC|nr:hypothetical protein CDAR_217791 [Caerostris darwini]